MSTTEVTRIIDELKALSISFATLSTRFDDLDKKVDLHNGLVERMYCMEKKVDQLCVEHHRIQNEKEKKKINWASVFSSILSGVTVGLLVYMITRL